MNRRIHLLTLSILGGLAAATATAQEDVPGLAVGSEAPVVQLKDQQGQDQSLQELLKEGKVALVFYRSADW